MASPVSSESVNTSKQSVENSDSDENTTDNTEKISLPYTRVDSIVDIIQGKKLKSIRNLQLIKRMMDIYGKVLEKTLMNSQKNQKTIMEPP